MPATQSVRKPSRVYLRRGHPLTRGLVFSYPFFEGRGSTIHDVSGRTHSGTFNGPSWVLGQWGPAVSFDGSDNISITPPPVTGSQNRSFLMWAFQDTGVDHSNNFMFSYGSNNTSERASFKFGNNNEGGLRLEIGGTGGDYDFSGETTATNFPEGEWLVHGYVLNGTSLDDVTLYHWNQTDGLLSGSPTDTTTINTQNTAGVAEFGESGFGFGDKFAGDMDIPTFWNRALLGPEVKQYIEDTMSLFITKPR